MIPEREKLPQQSPRDRAEWFVAELLTKEPRSFRLGMWEVGGIVASADGYVETLSSSSEGHDKLVAAIERSRLRRKYGDVPIRRVPCDGFTCLGVA